MSHASIRSFHQKISNSATSYSQRENSEIFSASLKKDNQEWSKLEKLWDELGVKKEYRTNFQAKVNSLSGFRTRKGFIQYEEGQMKDFKDFIIYINTETNKYQKKVEEVKNLIHFCREMSKVKLANTNLEYIKTIFLDIKKMIIQITDKLIKAKRKFFLERNKFEFEKIKFDDFKYNGCFDLKFSLSLLNQLNFLRGNAIGKTLEIFEPIDILFFEVNKKQESKQLSLEEKMDGVKVENISVLHYLVQEYILKNNKSSSQSRNNRTKGKTSSTNKYYRSSKENRHINQNFNIDCKNKIKEPKKLSQTEPRRQNEKIVIESNKKRDEPKKQIEAQPRKQNEKVVIESNKKADEPKKQIEAQPRRPNEKIVIESNKKADEPKKQIEEKPREPNKKVKNESNKRINDIGLLATGTTLVEENPEKRSFEPKFLTTSLSSFSSKYTLYYKRIPSFLKKPFNITHSLTEPEGIMPTVLYTDPLVSLFIFSRSKEDPNSIVLSHFSALFKTYQEIKEELSNYINFLVNKIPFKALSVELFCEKIDDKLKLNKDINDLFRDLKFTWVNLVNKSDGVRCQTMKFENKNYSEEKNKSLPVIDFQSYYISNPNEENITNNCLNITLCKMMDEVGNLTDKEEIEEKEKEIDNILSTMNGDMIMNKGTMKENKDFHEECKSLIPFKEFSSDSEEHFTSCFFKHRMIVSNVVSIEGEYYFYIPSEIVTIVQENETMQTLYMIELESSLRLIICNPTIEFISKLNDQSDISNLFSQLLESMSFENKEVPSLFVPLINYNGSNISITTPFDKNSPLTSLPTKKNYKDVVFNKSMFIALFKEELSEQVSTPIILSTFVN